MSKPDKFVFIMRGIPGSGKSTAAEFLGSTEDSYIKIIDCVKYVMNKSDNKIIAAIHSTDQYLVNEDGEYEYDKKKIQQNHNLNYKDFVSSLRNKVDKVIVDNTNIKKRDFKRYVTAAYDYGYAVLIISVPPPSVGEAVARNVHSVPSDVVKRMYNEWEPY